MIRHETIDVAGETVDWISECYEVGGKHHTVNTYVLSVGDRYVMVDAGTILEQAEFKRLVDDVTDGTGIDALVLTHADLPHSGNVKFLREQWDFDFYCTFTEASFKPETMGLGEAIQCDKGQSMEIFGREFRFLIPQPRLSDAGHEMAVLDSELETLFVADGLGCYHSPEHCGQPGDGVPRDEHVAGIAAYHLDALPFVVFLDPHKIEAQVRGLFEDNDIDCLAPIHANPVVGREDVLAYVEAFIEAMHVVVESEERPSSVSLPR